MKQTLSWSVVLCASLLPAGGWFQSAQEKGTLEERVVALELVVEGLSGTAVSHTSELQELRVQADQTLRYLKAQAESAQAMAATLDTSEKEGFTQGINFESRETLLAGWRARLTAIGKDLPGAEPEKPVAEDKRARRARK